ncbi:MAG: hypothetical protein KKC01_08525 [Gammaproteobacteria bacterium]|nr:hypothetical protein [Gammaproteobacteria bacterium]
MDFKPASVQSDDLAKAATVNALYHTPKIATTAAALAHAGGIGDNTAVTRR